MAIKKSGKRRIVTVDMEGVESGGQIVDEGVHDAKIHEIEEKESSNGNPMLVMKWQIISKKSKGAIVWDNISLTPQALWRLKGLLEALGEDIPDSSLDIDIDDLTGKECRIEIANEKFEGKDRPRISRFASSNGKENDTEDEEEDEKPAKKPSKTPSKAKSTSEDSDDEKEDDEEEEEEEPKKKVGTGVVKGGKVKFKDDKGKTIKGIVISIKGDVAKVSDDDDDEWEIELSELEATK